eukprot:jgi/Chrzof1/10543/Cz05g02190.t1
MEHGPPGTRPSGSHHQTNATSSCKAVSTQQRGSRANTQAVTSPPTSSVATGWQEEALKPQPVPLKLVVHEAVRRWFEDTQAEAHRGDVKQQALLGQMYAEGYGCDKDSKAAREWADKALSRGYRMMGVYCEL